MTRAGFESGFGVAIRFGKASPLGPAPAKRAGFKRFGIIISSLFPSFGSFIIDSSTS